MTTNPAASFAPGCLSVSRQAKNQTMPAVCASLAAARPNPAAGLARGAIEADGKGKPIPAWKRVLDIAIVLLALPAAVLIGLFLSIYIKLVSPGPIFFRQERIGRGGRPFRLFKFRTMHVDTSVEIHQSHLANLIGSDQPMEKLDAVDPRIIPCGRLIRSSGLDELPQLINVLRGEMSVVGPRPCTPYEYERYEPWHKERLEALPGLTGLWQVSGKNKTTFNEMVRLDVYYAKHLSLGLDLKIILRTFPTLLDLVSDHLATRRRQKAIARGPAQAQAEAA